MFPVDANLRPEGRHGPLVRTLASHEAYYKRWARTWEYQALLKARPVAGDLELGQQYADMIAPMVWSAASRPNFVTDVQAMRRRVVENIPKPEVERQVKLGPGGSATSSSRSSCCRWCTGAPTDGSTPAARFRRWSSSPTTATSAGWTPRRSPTPTSSCATSSTACSCSGCGGPTSCPTDPDDAALARPGHGLPGRRAASTPSAPGTSARSGGCTRSSSTDRCSSRWPGSRRPRPLQHPPHAARPRRPGCRRSASRTRPAALGHLQALSIGLSRTATIQRVLLPAMLDAFADAADPDAGLKAYRQVSDALGRTPWYLRLLRDEGTGGGAGGGGAAERLARLLASSPYVADLMTRAPGVGAAGAVRWTSCGRAPASRWRRRCCPSCGATPTGRTRSPPPGPCGASSWCAWPAPTCSGRSTSSRWARRCPMRRRRRWRRRWRSRPARSRSNSAARCRRPSPSSRWGGSAATSSATEAMPTSCSSTRPVRRPTMPPRPGPRRRWPRRCGACWPCPAPDPPLLLDLGLRPEGRNGPLARSLASYAVYYKRWSIGWEAQALLRAVPIAGDVELGFRFVELADSVRYPETLPASAVAEVVRLKSRMERERMPKGVDRTLHLKLGPGGLTDVEWAAQLLQLQHGARHPGAADDVDARRPRRRGRCRAPVAGRGPGAHRGLAVGRAAAQRRRPDHREGARRAADRRAGDRTGGAGGRLDAGRERRADGDASRTLLDEHRQRARRTREVVDAVFARCQEQARSDEPAGEQPADGPVTGTSKPETTKPEASGGTKGTGLHRSAEPPRGEHGGQ